MADILDVGLLLDDNRVFLPSEQINIFPCSRRGQSGMEGSAEHFDPEARLNTERTNRISTAINGFTDSFIVNDNFTAGDTLVFTLAGYRVEAKNFNPAYIANALGISSGTIYAHLSLHGGISLQTGGYFTEILYRQSTLSNNKNYLDVTFKDTDTNGSGNFFVGISFTKGTVEDTDSGVQLIAHDLSLFSKAEADTEWQLVQTSLLPKIEHGTTENSVVIPGNATINEDLTVQNNATIKAINVPYDKKVEEDFENTAIDNSGIKASYIYTKSLAAEGISVGGAISVVDNIESPTEMTTIGSNSITTTGAITAKESLNVQSDTEAAPATANIDKAIIEIAELGTLTVADDTSLQKLTADETELQSLTVNTATELKSTLKVEDKATLDNELEVANKATLKNGLDVTGDTKLQKLDAGDANLGSLSVTGTTELLGKTTVKNDFSVTGVAEAPKLAVNTITSNSEKVTVDKDLIVSGDTQLQTMTVQGLTDEKITQLKELHVSEKAEFKQVTATETDAGKITANELWLDTVDNDSIGQVPALELAYLTKTDTYQLRFKFGTPVTIIEE